jgi:glycosyltransferase involved in cell wall biosynthesis
LEVQPIRSQVGFRKYILESVSVVLSSSLTDADQYVGRDAISQGRPVVGSQTIRYLPRDWQADPNDPADIARVAVQMLDNYERYCREAVRLAHEIRDRQREAYHRAIERILG